jgi:hypothetical protein
MATYDTLEQLIQRGEMLSTTMLTTCKIEDLKIMSVRDLMKAGCIFLHACIQLA